MENSGNALMYDVKEHVLIDPYGTGLLDVCRHSYTVGQGVSTYSTAALRNFKMIANGFGTTAGQIVHSGALNILMILANAHCNHLTTRFGVFLKEGGPRAIHFWKAARKLLENEQIRFHLGEPQLNKIRKELNLAVSTIPDMPVDDAQLDYRLQQMHRGMAGPPMSH